MAWSPERTKTGSKPSWQQDDPEHLAERRVVVDDQYLPFTRYRPSPAPTTGQGHVGAQQWSTNLFHEVRLTR